jgi:hypothetical protein
MYTLQLGKAPPTWPWCRSVGCPGGALPLGRARQQEELLLRMLCLLRPLALPSAVAVNLGAAARWRPRADPHCKGGARLALQRWSKNKPRFVFASLGRTQRRDDEENSCCESRPELCLGSAASSWSAALGSAAPFASAWPRAACHTHLAPTQYDSLVRSVILVKLPYHLLPSLSAPSVTAWQDRKWLGNGM